MNRIASKAERLAVLRNLKRNNKAALIQARVRGLLARKMINQSRQEALKSFYVSKPADEDDDNDGVDDNDIEEEAMSVVAIDEETQSTKAEHKPWPQILREDFSTDEWPKLEEDNHIEEWILHHKKLAVRYITWNLCAQKPPPRAMVEKTLIPTNRFHILVIGTEECERSIAQSALNTSKKNWESYLTALLGDIYIPIKSHTLQAIHCIVFAHRVVAHLITEVKSAAVPCGVGNTMGNKGGVGIFFKAGRTSFVVVNAHLAAHQNAVKQRNNDCNKICKEIPISLRKKKMVAMVLKDPRVSNKSKSLDSEVKVETAMTGNLNANLQTNGLYDSKYDSKVSAIAPSVPALSPDVTTPSAPISTALTHAIQTVPVPTTINAPSNIAVPTSKVATIPALSISAALASGPNDVPVVKPSISPTVPSMARDVKSFGVKPASMPSLEAPAAAERASSTGASMLDECADRVVFMGDLNYRIRGNRSAVDMLLVKEMHEVLQSNDQLKWSLQRDLILKNFTEAPLNFKPTYKLDINSDAYDTGSKKRIPAWTDRILFAGQGMHCVAYDADFTLKTSDHRPVYASFLIDIDVDTQLMHGRINEEKLVPRFSNESQVCIIS